LPQGEFTSPSSTYFKVKILWRDFAAAWLSRENPAKEASAVVNEYSLTKNNEKKCLQYFSLWYTGRTPDQCHHMEYPAKAARQAGGLAEGT
jgi:hypothetical protein